MKRTHTAYPQRYGHHERAALAVQFERLIRRLMKPLRLYMNGRRAARSDEIIEGIGYVQENCARELSRQLKIRVEIAAERMAIERGV